MKLTKLEAIEQHRDMWNRIYQYCNERYDSKTVPNAREIKTIILKEMNGGKDDEYVCQNGKGCLNCWLRSGLIYEKDNLENASNSDKVIKSELIQNRIKELKNSRAGYMVCGISCNHAVVAELERLLKEVEDKEV